MKREQKLEVINRYNQVFNEYGKDGSIILAEYAGINVTQMKSLRQELTKNGAQMSVVKNRLAKIALKNTDCENLSEHFTGPLSMVYSKDPVAMSKALVDFADGNKALKISVGIVDGVSVDKNQITALSKLPSLDELRAKLLSLLMAPARNIACVVNQVPQSIARVLQAKSDQEK